MQKIMLSINSAFVKLILDGKKKFEYRKRLCRKDIDKILIYETSPIKKVVGEVDVIDILSMDKEKLWDETKAFSGISKDFYLSYFHNYDTAVAYKLGKINCYKKLKSLSDFGISAAPQSFVYV